MQLSAELYAQIVKDLVSDGLGEFGRQQRREPRVGVRARAYILPSVSATVPVPVRVRDVSVGGMGLLLPREMSPDRLFLLLLPKGGGHPPVRLACRVAHCQAIAEDLFAVGARFARWDEIAALGADVTCRPKEWTQKAVSAKAKLAQRLASSATTAAVTAAASTAKAPATAVVAANAPASRTR
jgi:hypothetical protein